MTNYIGSEIGQILLSNQSSMNEKIDANTVAIIELKTKMDGYEISSLWSKVRNHEKIIYMGAGAGFVVGWFTKVLIGK